jgi:hypothetical protein
LSRRAAEIVEGVQAALAQVAAVTRDAAKGEAGLSMRECSEKVNPLIAKLGLKMANILREFKPTGTN